MVTEQCGLDSMNRPKREIIRKEHHSRLDPDHIGGVGCGP